MDQSQYRSILEQDHQLIKEGAKYFNWKNKLIEGYTSKFYYLDTYENLTE